MNYLNKAFTTAVISISVMAGCGQSGSKTASKPEALEFSKSKNDQFALSIPDPYLLANEAGSGNPNGEELFGETEHLSSDSELSDHIEIVCQQTREEAGLSGDKLQLFVRLYIYNAKSGDMTYVQANKTFGCFGDAAIYLRELRHDRVYQVVAGFGLEGQGLTYIGATEKFSLQEFSIPMNMQRYWGDTVRIEMFFPVTGDPADPTDPVECNCEEIQDPKPIERQVENESGPTYAAPSPN